MDRRGRLASRSAGSASSATPAPAEFGLDDRHFSHCRCTCCYRRVLRKPKNAAASPARLAPAAKRDQLRSIRFCRLSRCQQTGLCRARERKETVVGTPVEFGGGAATRWHGQCNLSFLVARQPDDWFFCRRQAEED